METAVLYDVKGAKRFFQRGPAMIEAVGGVDLQIGAGEFVALEGPSGSGKTTLLQLLGALDRPSAGSVFFEGRDLGALGDGELAELRLNAFGFVFQQFNLIPTLTALENVEAGSPRPASARPSCARGRSGCSRRSASPIAHRTCRPTSPAGSSSASRSPGPSSSGRA